MSECLRHNAFRTGEVTTGAGNRCPLCNPRGVDVWTSASGLCQAVGMAKKRTKADKLQRQIEQQEEGVDRRPEEIEKKPSTLAPKSDEPTVLISAEQQIRQRAYELYEQRGRIDGRDLDDWLQAERSIKGRQAKAARA